LDTVEAGAQDAGGAAVRRVRELLYGKEYLRAIEAYHSLKAAAPMASYVWPNLRAKAMDRALAVTHGSPYARILGSPPITAHARNRARGLPSLDPETTFSCSGRGKESSSR
jgi:hypothetical protein